MVQNKDRGQQGQNDNRRGGRGDRLTGGKLNRETQREDQLQENHGRSQKATPNRTESPGKK